MERLIPIIYIYILSSCINNDKYTPSPTGNCPNNQLYKADSVVTDFSPIFKDTIQIIEINGIDVTKKDTIFLNTFCDVKFRVKINSTSEIIGVHGVSENKGFWRLDTKDITESAVIFNFIATNLNGFAYTQDKVNFGFNYWTGNGILKSTSKLFIRKD